MIRKEKAPKSGGNLLVKSALVYTMGPAGILENADVLVQNGRIVQVGKVAPRGDETVLFGKGLVVTPGLIDPHTHVGLWEEGYPESESSGNEATDPLTPQLRVLDAFHPMDQAFEDARNAGVTTIQILPGSANVLGGEGVVVKTSGIVADSMVRRVPSGMKAAFGENPKNLYKSLKKYPSTRMAVAACMREAFTETRNYRGKIEKALEKGEEPERNLKYEALLRVLKGEVPLRIHAHRSDDIVTALRIAREFGISCTLEHGTEGHLIASLLAERKIPVAYGPVITSRAKLELKNRNVTNLLAMLQAGVPLSLTTDHPVVPLEYLLLQGMLLRQSGVPAPEVLKLLTVNPAAHLGLSQEIGSLEEGKCGDLVLWSGDPLEPLSRALVTVIDGEVVFRRQ
jgi:imidazolonepropionase-like amidohydrolase